MRQTQILLLNAREDHSGALNVLFLVQQGLISVTVEDVMFAYLVAKDWCQWVADPSFSVGPLKRGKGVDYTPLLNMFQSYASRLEILLCRDWVGVREVFQGLNPNLVQNLKSQNPMLRDMTKLFYRSLWATARLFETKIGDNLYRQILEEAEIPDLDCGDV